jgi:hypothetical protein
METFAECPGGLVAMCLSNDDVFDNASEYAKRRHRNILRQDSPGFGTDGWIWKTSLPSAVKAFYRHSVFRTELACYQRLKSCGVNQIHGLDVPILEGHDEELQVIETTFVKAPYLLDFGKATLDDPPAYYRDPMDIARFHSQWKSEFGDRWPNVSAALYTLRTQCGIYYLDPRPPNINFGESDDGDEWTKEPLTDYGDDDWE